MTVPASGPFEKLSTTEYSSNTLAGQSGNAAGVKARMFEPPIVPEDPVTVTVITPPSELGLGPVVTTVTLLAAAEITCCTEMNEKLDDTSAALGGRATWTLTVCPWARAVAAEACR